MGGVIAILEDDEGRAAPMRENVAKLFPDLGCVIFDNAGAMVEWLRKCLKSAMVISLDHDLRASFTEHGIMIDPGTGRDVVHFLVSEEPTCPIIIHTSNAMGGDAMQSSLEGAGWVTCRILPFGESWIETEWCEKISEFLSLQ